VELYLHPNKPLRRGDQLKHEDFTFTFTFTYPLICLQNLNIETDGRKDNKESRDKIHDTHSRIQFQIVLFWVVTPCSECGGWIPTFRRFLLPPSSG